MCSNEVRGNINPKGNINIHNIAAVLKAHALDVLCATGMLREHQQRLNMLLEMPFYCRSGCWKPNRLRFFQVHGLQFLSSRYECLLFI